MQQGRQQLEVRQGERRRIFPQKTLDAVRSALTEPDRKLLGGTGVTGITLKITGESVELRRA